MGELRCVDGSILTVTAVACNDRLGVPYEITLDLSRGGEPFASVGERCGSRLTELAGSVTAAREDPAQAAAWPDPDDRFPEPDQPGSAGQSARPEFRPGDREYFSLRSRDRSDLPGTGEFRCVLRDSAEWLGELRPGWCLTRRAVIEAWGSDGIGVRAVLTSAELVTFLDTVLREPGGAAVAGCASGATATTAGMRLARFGKPSWRQRGRVRDGSTRSRLPALRAQNRSVAFASGDPQARRGDVRR
jgi:hypothetical protein